MSGRFGVRLGAGLGLERVLQLDWVSDSDETVSRETERLAGSCGAGRWSGGGGGGGSMLDVMDAVIKDEDII